MDEIIQENGRKYQKQCSIIIDLKFKDYPNSISTPIKINAAATIR